MLSSKKLLSVFLIAVFLILSGCADCNNVAAPVRDVNVHRVGKVMYHLVQPGETLYSIAWRYEKDYRALASLNNLAAPYQLQPGGLIRLTGNILRNKPYQHNLKTKQTVHHWLWPTNNRRVIRSFTARNKGIDIAGNYQDPIFAAAQGQVVYAGNGLRGYGNLLIIKHNSLYLTAYAYNSRLLVKQGQKIKAGQKIALMGKNTNLGQNALHFEIRKAGKAINPRTIL